MKSLRSITQIALTLLFSISVSFAQENLTKYLFKDKLFFGGNLGLQFGNLTYVDVSPLIGYKITEKLHAGIGATYIYYRYKDSFGNYETSIYGGRVFGRYYPIDNLFAHVEYEILNLDVPASVPGSNYDVLVRDNISSVLVGGGYVQPIGTNASLMLMVLFNLTEEQYSPYQNPIFRIGINAGF
ncbi:MAG: hypothetical protein IPP71_21290 [Bacteroidetes bacterium]|nr:hypothetical protein [Bacteroidota bacterium]